MEFSKRWKMNAAESVRCVVRDANVGCSVVPRNADIIRMRQIVNLKIRHLHFVRCFINDERVEGKTCG